MTWQRRLRGGVAVTSWCALTSPVDNWLYTNSIVHEFMTRHVPEDVCTVTGVACVPLITYAEFTIMGLSLYDT